MSQSLQPRELLILKTIAETLNRGTELEPMLEEALARLLELTGLQAGWIFLVGPEPEYACVADRNLPPALCRDGKRPMREGVCWCLASYWEGRLQHATNIIECKRLEDAVAQGWGDTRGLTHHATVPLTAGGTRFGLLNVGAPGKVRFGERELALLQAVALQMGTAIERVRLYQAQRRRAEAFVRAGEVQRRLAAVLDPEELAREAVRQVAAAFGWPVVALFLREGGDLSLRALWDGDRVRTAWRRVPAARAGLAGRALGAGGAVRVDDVEREPALRAPRGCPAYRAALAAPLCLPGRVAGVLLAGSPQPRAFDGVDAEVLEAVAAHVALALENARLDRRRQELARLEERQRLARELHDAASQQLFALTLAARAARDLLPPAARDAAAALDRVLELAQAAQREMRALIWQLRPADLEGGLLAALARHAGTLGLAVEACAEGVAELPPQVEAALWRIGQEALQNVRKHAGVEQARVLLRVRAGEAVLEVADAGRGFTPGRVAGSLGLVSMRERAEALGGTLEVESRPGRGTRVRARIPLRPPGPPASGGGRRGRDGEGEGA